MQEFIIWGIPNGDEYEQVLYTRAESIHGAERVMAHLYKEGLATNCRIQVIDGEIPDFTKAINV